MPNDFEIISEISEYLTATNFGRWYLSSSKRSCRAHEVAYVNRITLTVGLPLSLFVSPLVNNYRDYLARGGGLSCV